MLLLTYSEFSKFNDGWMVKYRNKPKNKKWFKIVCYPFALIGWSIILILFYSFISMVVNSSRNASRYNYRTDNKYKKVIKEGILFDTVEYHER